MKIDLYTKGILTVIAVALMFICVKDMPIVKDVIAQESPILDSKVGVCHYYLPYCADVVRTSNGEALLVKIVE